MYEDVLAELFGYSQDAKGALLVTCAADFGLPNPEDTDLVATTRTYDVSSPVGTYGQTVPANGELANLTGSPSFVTGARNNADFRSNLGIVNQALDEVTVHYRIIAADATVLAEGSEDLPSLSMRQWSFRSLGVGTAEGPLTVDLWLDPDDVSPDPCADFVASFLAYVSKVDQRTQDAEFMYAAPFRIPDCTDR